MVGQVTAERETERRESRVIEHYCAVLREAGEDIEILRWPDREGVQSGCEAIVRRGTEEWVLEHTTVYSLPSRPGLLPRLQQLRTRITERVLAAYPSEAVLIFFPIEEIPTGENWDNLADRIATACIAAIPTIPEEQGLRLHPEGVPFEVVTYRLTHAKAGGACWVQARTAGEDQVVADLRRAIGQKRPKLLREKAHGRRTCLVLEGPEVGWPNDFAKGFKLAAEQESVAKLDEVLFAATATDPMFLYYFKLGSELLPHPQGHLRSIEAELRLHERTTGWRAQELAVAVELESRIVVTCSGATLYRSPTLARPTEVYLQARRFGQRALRYVAQVQAPPTGSEPLPVSTPRRFTYQLEAHGWAALP